MKKVMKKRVYQYTGIFEPAEEGGYTVTIPSLPGCISESDTFEEALENIKEAASLYLEAASRQEKEPKGEKGVIVAPIHIAA